MRIWNIFVCGDCWPQTWWETNANNLCRNWKRKSFVPQGTNIFCNTQVSLEPWPIWSKSVFSEQNSNKAVLPSTRCIMLPLPPQPTSPIEHLLLSSQLLVLWISNRSRYPLITRLWNRPYDPLALIQAHSSFSKPCSVISYLRQKPYHAVGLNLKGYILHLCSNYCSQ